MTSSIPSAISPLSRFGSYSCPSYSSSCSSTLGSASCSFISILSFSIFLILSSDLSTVGLSDTFFSFTGFDAVILPFDTLSLKVFSFDFFALTSCFSSSTLLSVFFIVSSVSKTGFFEVIFSTFSSSSASSPFFNVEMFLIPLSFAYCLNSAKDAFLKSICAPFLFY